MASAKTLFPNKAAFTGTRDKDANTSFWGDRAHPTTDINTNRWVFLTLSDCCRLHSGDREPEQFGRPSEMLSSRHPGSWVPWSREQCAGPPGRLLGGGSRSLFRPVTPAAAHPPFAAAPPSPLPIQEHLDYFTNICGTIFLAFKKANILQWPFKSSLPSDNTLCGGKAPTSFLQH